MVNMALMSRSLLLLLTCSLIVYNRFYSSSPSTNFLMIPLSSPTIQFFVVLLVVFALLIVHTNVSLLDLTSLTISPYFFCSFYSVAMLKSTLAILMILSSVYALQLKNQVLCYNVNNVLVGCTTNV